MNTKYVTSKQTLEDVTSPSHHQQTEGKVNIQEEDR